MPNLTLSMIVKNEEKYLQECLESVQNIADEIVIIDTGSIDNTLEIAKKFNCKIFNYEWTNDFASARNFALSKSTGNWILYLDADERISIQSKNEILNIINKWGSSGIAIPTGKDRLAVYCNVKSVDNNIGFPNLMKYVRLFRNDPKIKFTGAVHEQIDESLHNLNYKFIDSNIEIIHLGYNISYNEMKKKAKRNLEILLSEYDKQHDSYNAFQIAQTYGMLNEKEKAFQYFNYALDDKKLYNNYRAHALRYNAAIYLEKNLLPDALNLINEALKLNSSSPLINLVASKIYLRLRKLNDADKYCRKALIENKKLLSGEKKSTYEIMVNASPILYYALTFTFENNLKRSFDFYFNELKNLKEINNNFINCINNLLKNQDINEQSLNNFIGEIKNDNIEFILTLLSRYNNINNRLNILQNLENKFPNNIKLINLLANTFLNLNERELAEKYFYKSLSKDENNPSTYFYLISILVQQNKFNDIKNLIDELENRFSNFNEVMQRVEILKSKLSDYITI
ncbi:MAG: TPR domain-containing glycosyltransferase [Ignavibacterium sp.]